LPKFELPDNISWMRFSSSSGSSSSGGSLDHFLGLIAGFAGGLAVWAFHNWINERKLKRKKYGGDEIHRQTYNKDDLGSSAILKLHSGACHCKRVKFRIRAPTSLRAVDIPSKIRFPRITIPISNFEALTDDSIMSHYAVKFGKSIGIHTFCSFCGVHVVFAPSVNPVEVLVNLNCIDKTDIKDEFVTYYSGMDAGSPIPVSADEAKGISKKGLGSTNLSTTNESSPAQAVTSMVSLYNNSNTSFEHQHHDIIQDFTSPNLINKSLYDNVMINNNNNSSSSSGNNNNYSGDDSNENNSRNSNVNSNLPLSLDFIGSSSGGLNDDDIWQGNNNNNGSNGEPSPMVTPGKKTFAFDSPMHRQLLQHLQHHLPTSIGETSSSTDN